MTGDKRLPTPEQMRAFLCANGWTPESPLPTDEDDGVMFTYKELSDDGEPFTVLVPNSATALHYPLDVRAVVVTAAGMEDRPEADVLAEMLAVDVTPAPRAPAAPVS